jgi:hypothetical protein
VNLGQDQFRAAIFDPSKEVPLGLIDPKGRPAGKRFDVYRNNVVLGLTAAMEVSFPVVRKLVGDQFFAKLCGVFVRSFPPTIPMLMFYGAEFPVFLAQFKPVEHLGYLPDVARLELALRHSYHAADATPINPSVLQFLETDRLMTSTLGLASAVQVLSSDWPILSIWHANTQENAPTPTMRAEDILITRPGFDPVPKVLPSGGAKFVGALMDGDIFAMALDKAGEGFDLTAVFGMLLAGNAITQIVEA